LSAIASSLMSAAFQEVAPMMPDFEEASGRSAKAAAQCGQPYAGTTVG
jgi:hypothetical protein